MTTAQILIGDDSRPPLEAEPGLASSLRRLVAFRPGAADECGIDILRMQEISFHEQPPRISNPPCLVKGVAKLRGITVPTGDMRRSFKLDTVTYGAFTASPSSTSRVTSSAWLSTPSPAS